MEWTTHYIENEHLKIGVLETGAELCSILNKKSGREHIWQANPDVWGSHAPNLFPIIGMLKDGEYKFEGATYSLPKHGIIRHNEQIRLKERTEDQLVFDVPVCANTDLMLHSCSHAKAGCDHTASAMP